MGTGPREAAGPTCRGLLRDFSLMSFLESFTERLKALEVSAGENYAHEVVQHECRVEALVGDFTEALGLPAPERRDARLASRFHDIGKLRIPERILLKPSSLDPAERDLIEAHGMLGADILAESGLVLPDGFEEAVRYHHERWDGLGYEGLSGTDIPYVSRLLSIVDVYDALTAERVYRRAMSEGETLRHMIAQSDGVTANCFDPLIFRQFLEWRRDVSSTLRPADLLDLRAFLARGRPGLDEAGLARWPRP